MTPPQPESSGADGSNGSHEPIPHPDSLPKLRDCKTRLSVLLEVIDIHPESLDLQANDVHTELVIPAYELMKTEVAKACGPRWDTRDRRRFRETYQTAAKKWPAYDAALTALELGRDHGMSVVVDAMVQLEEPRSGYIDALLTFYEEFSDTLDLFFPP
jgi:hypothetical protein